jgi:hypothetical protein
LIGIWLGFVLHENKESKVKINGFIDAMLWILSIVVVIAIVMIAHVFQTPVVSFTSSLLSNALYMAFHRIAWALALAYIIFACENLKSGSIVKWFLSHPYWKPIGTMGLSLYVTHVIYMIYDMLNMRQSYYFGVWPMVSRYTNA